MDTRPNGTGRNTVYALWHIPSSTLLVTSAQCSEVEATLRGALGAGIPLEDLMLQVTCQGELIGHQHLGARIAEVLPDLPDRPGRVNGSA